MKLFKTCLGDSNGQMDDNVDVYNWDHGDKKSSGGSFTNPHLIKLVDATQDAQVCIIYIYIFMYKLYIYIYIYAYTHIIYIYMYIHIYIYVYIYI
jgi:hypothetical protein